MASTSTAVYDVINDRVLAMLDKGIVPWRKPWQRGQGEHSRPRNVKGRPYSGINAFMLNLLGYADPRFITFKQAKAMAEAQGNPKGGVRKGEHGFPVTFWKQLVIEVETEDGQTKKKRVPMLRYFTVFNVEQCEGIEFPALPLPTPTKDETHGVDIDAITANMPDVPRISHVNQDRAYYTPALDTITLPQRTQFQSAEGYAETLCHELSHSTGHKKRLGRDGIDNIDHFGSDRYAREELVAEFGAAFLMAEFGLSNPESVENMASYLAGWTTRIKEDPKALVVAAGRGEKAANYILGRMAEEQDEEKAA